MTVPNENSVDLVRIDPTTMPEVQQPNRSALPSTLQSVRLHIGEVSIELPEEMTAEQIARLVRALNHA